MNPRVEDVAHSGRSAALVAHFLGVEGVPGWPPQTCPCPFELLAPRSNGSPLPRGNSSLSKFASSRLSVFFNLDFPLHPARSAPAAPSEFWLANRFHRTKFLNETKFIRASILNKTAERVKWGAKRSGYIHPSDISISNKS